MANDNETKIKVSPVEVLTVRKVGSSYVYLGICNEDGREYASAHPNAAQWDTFVAAGNAALGRPAPAPSPRYAPSEELRFIEPLCAALAATGATQEQALAEITKAMQDYRAKAVKLALEQAQPMVVVLDGVGPAPTSTPLADRIATEQGPPVDLSGICSEGREEDVYGEGYAKGRADAAAMAREQGATVPRAGVLPILDDLRSIATALDFENTPGACSAWRRLEEAIGTLAKLTAAPTTQTEKG